MNEAAAQMESLYARQEKIHAREVQGRYSRLQSLAVVVLLGIYYLLPWIPWAGRQAVLFDLPARKFHIFGLTLWPQDFFFLSWLLIVAALLLFFATALVGRVWCGYACPQTIWTKAFVWIERLTEGTFNRRIKLDKAPWTPEKIARRSAKRVLWIAFALWTGFTFVGYFTPIQELGRLVLTFQLGGWETFWVGFYSLATYGNAGHLREQVCKYMCPYARFQSAMFDRDTLIVSYDQARGEPRGGRRRGVEPAQAGLGDCIDCSICVQVCPTGIDIREGLQYGCITCAVCIDACNQVMDKMNYPRGLIRYTTENALAGKPTRILRLRTIIYSILLLGLCAAFVVTLSMRSPVHLDVIRDRNALYRELPGGVIENVYTLRILNKSETPHEFELSVDGLPGLALETDPAAPRLNAGAVGSVVARVRVPRDAGSPGGGHDIMFTVHRTGESPVAASRRARFMIPLR
jgi:cytochrome c oxidase accessory protein FixG